MTTNVLLDTCAAIWLVENAPLSDQAVAAIDTAHDEGRPLHVSPFTSWEIGMLVARGRLPIATSPATWFRRLTALKGIALAELTTDILIGSSFLPGEPPRDPADRIIIASARELGLTIITRDRLILDYSDQGHVLALAC